MFAFVSRHLHYTVKEVEQPARASCSSMWRPEMFCVVLASAPNADACADGCVIVPLQQQGIVARSDGL